jgi:hypothetical protein
MRSTRASATRRMPQMAKGDCGRAKLGETSYITNLGSVTSNQVVSVAITGAFCPKIILARILGKRTYDFHCFPQYEDHIGIGDDIRGFRQVNSEDKQE